MTKYGGSSTLSHRPCSEDESTLHHILLWHARHTLHPLLSFAPPPSSFFRFFTFHPSWTSTFNSPNNNEKKKHSSQQPQHSHSVARDNAAMASDATTSPREVTSAGDAAEMGVYPRDPTSPGYPSSSANSTREGVSNNGATGITHPAISRIQRQSTISNVVFRGKEKVGGVLNCGGLLRSFRRVIFRVILLDSFHRHTFILIQIEKIGHRRVNLAGVVSYKKTPADQLKRGIQMGLEHFIGQISNKPVRDLLIQVSGLRRHLIEIERCPFENICRR